MALIVMRVPGCVRAWDDWMNPEAMVTLSPDALWSYYKAPLVERGGDLILRRGQSLLLKRGHADVSLGSAGKASCDGPAEFQFVARGIIHVSEGKIAFSGAGATRELIVSARNLMAVGRAASFMIEVLPDGLNIIRVFDGEVSLTGANTKLHTGQAAKVGADGVAHVIPPDEITQ